MNKVFFEQLDLRREFSRQREYTTTLAVADLPRLKDALVNDSGEVDVTLEFVRGERGGRVLKGRVETRLALECQRCLGAVEKDFSLEVHLGVVIDEAQIEQLDSRLEPLLAVEGYLVLADVVQDELLLQVPAVASHEQEDCSSELTKLQQEVAESMVEIEAQAKEDSPFAALKNLKLS